MSNRIQLSRIASMKSRAAWAFHINVEGKTIVTNAAGVESEIRGGAYKDYEGNFVSFYQREGYDGTFDAHSTPDEAAFAEAKATGQPVALSRYVAPEHETPLRNDGEGDMVDCVLCAMPDGKTKVFYYHNY